MGCFAAWLLFLQQSLFPPMGFQSAVVPLWGHGCMGHNGDPGHRGGASQRHREKTVPRSGGGHGGRRERCKLGGKGSVTQRERAEELGSQLLQPAVPNWTRRSLQPFQAPGYLFPNLALSPCCSGHSAPLWLPIPSVHPSAFLDGRFYAPLRPEARSRAAPL